MPLLFALALAAAVKLWLWLAAAVPFNGDEAVVALMARHILQGARPVFFYGQAYMGSLDAWLVAAAFRLVGESVGAVRLVQSLLYLGFLFTLWLLACRLLTSRAAAAFAALAAAVPPVLVTTYSTATLGGYGESLIFGNLILLIGHEIMFGAWQERPWAWAALGLTGGVAFWTLGIAGVYLLPVGLAGLWKFRASRLGLYALAGAAFLVGAMPWWVYNLAHGGVGVAEFSRYGLSPGTPGERFLGLVLVGLPALVGVRYPWAGEYLPGPLTVVGVLFFLGAVGVWGATARRGDLPVRPGTRFLLGWMVAGFAVVFIGTKYGVDATGRYLLPLYVPLALAQGVALAAAWRFARPAGVTLLVGLLLFNGAANWRAARLPDRITTQFDPIARFDNAHDAALIDFLTTHGETTGYSNYWVSYRIAFLSRETLIFAARLPYRADLRYTPLDSRYPPYDAAAASSLHTALITTQHPALDALLHERLAALDVHFSEAQIGVYHVYYALSRPVRPADLGLGEEIR